MLYANNELDKLGPWFTSKRFNVNTGKTPFILNIPHLLINNKSISEINHIKFLGATYDDSNF